MTRSASNPAQSSDDYPEFLNIQDPGDVAWIKACGNPLVWHEAALAALIMLGDKHGLVPWLVRQPRLDRVTAAAMFMHADNGRNFLRGEPLQHHLYDPVDIEDVFSVLCDPASERVFPDHGCSLFDEWEDERQKLVAELSDDPRFPMAVMASPVNVGTAEMPYYEDGDGVLMSKAVLDGFFVDR